MKYFFLFFCFQTFGFCSNAQSVISGAYNEKNVYISNPVYDMDGTYCTDSVLINGLRIASNFNVAAFEIDLKSMGFSRGDSINIEIYHKTDCSPHMLQSFHTPRKSKELVVQSDQHRLTLTSKPANSKKLEVQVYRWNKWVFIGEMNGDEAFSLDGKTHSGTNIIRVVSIDESGFKKPSNEVNVSGNKVKISYNYSRKTRTVSFSRATNYELYNTEGDIILNGSVVESIDLALFPDGKYYLNFDNENVKLTLR